MSKETIPSNGHETGNLTKCGQAWASSKLLIVRAKHKAESMALAENKGQLTDGIQLQMKDQQLHQLPKKCQEFKRQVAVLHIKRDLFHENVEMKRMSTSLHTLLYG